MAQKKKKRKKRKKSKKGTKYDIHSMTLAQLIQQGKQSLKNNNPFDSISVLKFASKKYGHSDKINSLLFRAYLIKERLLRKENKNVESNTAKQQSLNYIPDFKDFSEQDMILYVSAFSDELSMKAYGDYLLSHDNSPKIEQSLANHLLKNNNWKLLNYLDDSVPLKSHAAFVKTAVPLMKEGNWEDALSALRPVSRTSPFASVRMFCRAMVSFYNKDDLNALKAFSMIPDDFILSDFAGKMAAIISKNGNGAKNKAVKQLDFMWEGPVHAEKDIENLLHNVERKNISKIIKYVRSLSKAVSCDQPAPVQSYILESCWNLIYQSNFSEHDFQKIVEAILPPEEAGLLLSRTNLMKIHGLLPAAGYYISILDKEFFDPDSRKIAHALILLHTAKMLHRNSGYEPEMIYQIKNDKYRELLGIKSKDTEMILIEMTAKSIILDPLNQASYEFLVELPRTSVTARKKVEKALKIMQKYFPDNPFPCLELASLYYENNAFRKAENILKEAMKRAPHDDKVIDRHVLSLLISAETNLARNKLHLAERDIKKAEKLGSKNVWPFIIEKKILFKLMDPHSNYISKAFKKQFPMFGTNLDVQSLLGNEFRQLSLFDQLKIFSILILDLKKRSINRKKSVLKDLEKAFRNKLTQAGKLTSSQIADLLVPLKKEYNSIISSCKVAPVILKKSKNILKLINNSEIIQIYHIIFEPGLFNDLIQDMKQRLKTAENKDKILIKFYLISLQHIAGEKNNPDLFYEIINKIEKGPVHEELRSISRQLAKHASGPLKTAFEEFDFEIIEEDNFYPDIFEQDEDLPPIPFMFDDFGQDTSSGEIDCFIKDLESSGDVDEIMDNADEIKYYVEDMVDYLEIRGLPDSLILDMRQHIISKSPMFKQDLNSTAKLVEYAKIRSLISRECRIFLFGKSGKKG